MDDAQRERLKSLERHFKPGDALFREGDTTREMYILLEGVIEIRKGNLVIAKVRESDTYLGEMSTLLGTPRTATAIAATPCTAFCVPQEKVAHFFSHSPSLGMKLSKMLAERLQQMNVKYERLLKEVTTKDEDDSASFAPLVADPDHRYFLQMYIQVVNESVPLQDVAATLNLAADRLGKVLKTYEHAGLIQIKDRDVHFIEAKSDSLRKQVEDWQPF